LAAFWAVVTAFCSLITARFENDLFFNHIAHDAPLARVYRTAPG
jgi:hypothetical protein